MATETALTAAVVLVKRALRTYLAIAGSPTAELATMLLKTPDILDAVAAGDHSRIVADLDELTITIYDALIEHIQARLTQCQRDLVGVAAKQDQVVAASNYSRAVRVARSDPRAVGPDHCHALVRDGLELLRALTGADYPTVE